VAIVATKHGNSDAAAAVPPVVIPREIPQLAATPKAICTH
jgi:hypothetical protein